MAENIEELARLERRIDDVRRAIEQARHRGGWFKGTLEEERTLALLIAILRALEARRATVENGNK